jgi:hypothetical protein
MILRRAIGLANARTRQLEALCLLNLLFYLTNSTQVLIELLSIIPAKFPIQDMNILQHEIEHAPATFNPLTEVRQALVP